MAVDHCRKHEVRIGRKVKEAVFYGHFLFHDPGKGGLRGIVDHDPDPCRFSRGFDPQLIHVRNLHVYRVPVFLGEVSHRKGSNQFTIFRDKFPSEEYSPRLRFRNIGNDLEICGPPRSNCPEISQPELPGHVQRSAGYGLDRGKPRFYRPGYDIVHMPLGQKVFRFPVIGTERQVC